MEPHHRGPEDHDASGRPAPRGGPAARGRNLPAPARKGGDIVPRPGPPGVVVPPHGTASPPARSDHGDDGRAAASRVTEIVAGDLLLTVDPLGGGQVTDCPAERIPAVRRRTARERAARAQATRPAPPEPTRPPLPLLERAEETERLVKLIGRGRSVRVTGPSGAGRTALLNAVADRCADLAPDGVVRLSGYRRTPGDLLQELYAAVFHSDGYRPDRARLLAGVRDIGAVVILDDLEFGGVPLGELLGAAPECAFLVSATPDVASPLPGSHLEEMFLPGLSQSACAELLALAAERNLTDEEFSWAAELWFASAGLPPHILQAGALLRHCDRGASRPGEQSRTAGTRSRSYDPPPPPAGRAPLPSLAQNAVPADVLAARLSRHAQEALRVAVALGGECVHQSHLPALVGAEQADAALGELIAFGLATAVADHHRLAAGVLSRLSTGGVETAGYAVSTARHYAWWAGHPSVPAARVAAEAEPILAATAACRDSGEYGVAVLLARAAAPEFAASLHWRAWERALRIGQEAARLAGEVGEEAYFHHELGVLALCTGNPERARTELEASIGMRGVLGDRQGAAVGRRTLALVSERADRATALVPVPVRTPPAPRTEEPRTAAVRRPAHALPPGKSAAPAADGTTVRPALTGRHQHRRRNAMLASRRNLAAAGAGAVLVAVLGTVVTLGTASDNRSVGHGPTNGRQDGSADRSDGSSGPTADQPTQTAATSRPPSASASASGAAPATSVPAAPGTVRPTTAPGTPTRPAGGKSPRPTHKPTGKPSSTPSSSPTTSPTPPPASGSPSPTPTGTAPTGTASVPAPTPSDPSGSPTDTPTGTPGTTPDSGTSSAPAS